MAKTFKLPTELQKLIDSGVWPTVETEQRQHRIPIAPRDRIRQFVRKGETLFFYPPPFGTMAHEAKHNPFWKEFALPIQIDLNNALVIGDLGLGLDSLVILDYSENSESPSVKRLQWIPERFWRPRGTKWVLMCESFTTFAKLMWPNPQDL